MLYRQMGIALPRNSWQQEMDARFETIELKEARAGDLIFFKTSSAKTVHVAMMINDHEFIHSFTKEEGWICVSSLADERFYNGHFYYAVKIRRLKFYGE